MPDFSAPKVVDTGKASIRGIAALVVAMAHAYGIFIWPHVGDGIASRVLGQAAHQSVMIFFIISGFLIALSIKTNIEKNSGQFDLIRYLISRSARIYPPLFFALATTVIIFLIINHFELPGYSVGNPYDIGKFKPSRETFQISIADIKNVALMNNGMLEANGPLWSLCIEWRIYIVVGFIAALLYSKNIFLKLFFLTAAYYFFIKLRSVNEHSIFYLSVWLIGGVYGVFHKNIDCFLSKTRVKFLFALIGLLALLAAIQPSLLISGGSIFGAKENLFQLIISTFWCIFLLESKAAIRTNLRKISMWLGEISYSVYILHFPLMLLFLSLFQEFIKENAIRSMSIAIAAMGSTVVISTFSAKYFENKVFFEKVIMRFTSLMRTFLIRNNPKNSNLEN